MDTGRMISELKILEVKHRNDKVFTGQLNISEMAHDVRERLEELKPYEDTGLTPAEVQRLREKNTPKEAIYEGDGYSDEEMVYDTWICPNCGAKYEVDYDDYDFCPDCGQMILR